MTMEGPLSKVSPCRADQLAENATQQKRTAP